MINFCVEPKEPCCKNPIGELDFKIDKCYSSIYSRLCRHENDSVSHISQEERDEWNGKASNSALLDLQNRLNEIAGDGDNSIKKQILIEVSRQIAGAITDLNIEEYAKKKYVDDAISNIDFDQYITKNDADSTYLNKADYIRFDPTNYYTIAQIQKIIGDSTIGKDYPIQSFTLEHNELILTQKNGGQFRVALSENGSDGGLDTDYVQQQLLNYIKKNSLSKLIINDRAYSIESGRDIRIPTSGAGSNIDLNKFGYNKSYFKEQPSNSAAPSKPSANQPPQDGSGWIETPPNYRPGYYIWMTQVFINGNGQYGEYTNPICLTGTAGENAVSYDIKTSTSTINYQDDTMYPDLISVYVAKSDGSQITNITPSNSSNWSFSYSINGGNTWTTISSDQIQTEGDNGMLFKATNGTITLTEYVPIIRSGINGLNGITYSLQLSNISLSYAPADQDYNLQMNCNVNLYKNGTSVNDTEANLYMQLNSNSRTSLQYDSDHWTVTVNTTVQSKSSTITIYAENKNGAHLTSMTIPVSSSGDKGDPGDGSIGQTFKGSPLRIVGAWTSGKKYYDGKRDAENGIFYQDVVLYENMYYVCVNTDSGESDHWAMTPDVATYFQKFTVTENFVTDKIIANQAYIKELSSEEVVIMDGDAIVAGMTSSKKPDSKSDLNGKVENKGNVRIWAGEISNADLTTAPFTVTSNGNLTAHKATLYDATFYAENAQVKITNERSFPGDQSTFQFEDAGISISGNSEEYGDSKMFFGMQTGYEADVGGVHFPKVSTPVAYVSNKNSKVRIAPGLIKIDGENAKLTVKGTTILNGYTLIDKLGCIVRRDSLESSLDNMCSVSINAGTHGGLGGDSITITLPNSVLGRDIIIVNSKWNQLIVKVPNGYTLYKSGTSVEEVQMPKYTMAHAIQIGSLAWIVGMMT